MDPVVEAAVIASVPPTLMALVAVWLGIRNGNRLQGIHVDINSRITQLIEVGDKLARAEATAAEKIRADAEKGSKM